MLLSRYCQTEFTSQEDFAKNFRVSVPESFNYAYDVVDEWARLAPDKLAMDWCDQWGAEKTFTFAQMRDASMKAAAWLSSLGVVQGDKVMLILKRRHEFWACLLGLHRIGAVGVPATHLLTAKDIAYRCNAASIKMIVTVDDEATCASVDAAVPDSPTLTLRAKLGDAREGWLSYDQDVAAAPAAFPRGTYDNADTLLLYFTSGTTGMPKMVRHNQVYPLGHIVTARFWHNLHENSKHLTVADTGWAKSVWGKLYGQWLVGACVMTYDYDRFSAHDMLDMMVRHKVTSFCAPPTVYRFMIKEDLSGYDLSALEWATTAGEPLNPEVYERWLEKTGLKLHECYGQTEATVMLLTSPFMEPHPGSMGMPTPGYNIGLIDEDGNEVETGEQGEIVVRRGEGEVIPGLFEEYYRDDALTQNAWAGGVYHTGDMAWRDEDGYFWFIGRADDVIKSSGYRIGPFEVESALMEHPKVLECAVTGVPDPERGAVVKATIVLVKGTESSDALAKELQDHVKHVTAPYKYPRIVEFVEELPKTISGKIQRTRIRARDAGQK